jgi:hypothetical protein
MRLKSELWVKAYLRRTADLGVPGVVVRRGDPDAGAIYIKVARLDGTADLYGPAPAGLVEDDGERRWSRVPGLADEAAVDIHLERERKMDTDLWIVEIEDRAGRAFLEGWLHQP